MNGLIRKTIIIHEDLTIRIASLVNKDLIFYDGNDRQFLLGKEWISYQELEKEDKKIHWLPFDAHCDDINFLPLYYHKSYNDKKLGFWNITTKEITWLEKAAISKVIVLDKTCLIRRGDELKDFSRFSKFDLSNGRLIWDFNSKDLFPDRKRGFLDKILGIYNNQLLLQPRADRVIRLDLDTGKVISSISSYHHN